MDALLQSIRQLFRSIRTMLVEYCNHSNIHGVRYLTEEFLHWTERLWWIIALGVSFGLCSFAAINILIEWRTNPVTLSHNGAPILISDIPFPTITICPQIKTDINKFDLTAAFETQYNLTEEQHIALNSLAHICPNFPKSIQRKDDFAHKDIHRMLQAIAPHYEKTFAALESKIFKYATIVPVLTEEGLCFTYNALNSHDIYTEDMAPEMMIVNDNRNLPNWSLEKDIQGKLFDKNFPIHEIRSQSFPAFSVDLKAYEEDLEHECKGRRDQGFIVFLGTPGDDLKFSENSYRLPLDVNAQIFIKATLTTTSEAVRKYDPQQRQCFFDSERRLRFFKIYSQSNCEAECLANFTKVKCGCVKFSQPRHTSTKVCGVTKVDCYKSAEQVLSSGDSNTKPLRDKCNCLPSCTSIVYERDTRIRRINLENVRKSFLSSHSNLTFFPIRFSFVRVLFESERVNVVTRIESYTLTDFLAFYGGLLGIFLGISALSFVEIIYYATLHLYFIIRPMEISNAVIPFHQQSSNIFERFRLIRGIRAFIVEFCDNSNIHGFVYFTRRGLHWIERLFWIVSFGISLWLCTTMITDVWQGWQENPVKMTFTRNERHISAVPFPTVTICPYSKFMRHKLDLNPFYNYLYHESNVRNEIRSLRDNKTFRSALHLCSSLWRRIQDQFQLQSFPAFADENIFDIIQDIAPQFDNVVHKCIWQGKVVNCSMYMTPILTELGYCFTFNSLNSHEIYTNEMAPGLSIVQSNSNTTNWSMENGYGTVINQNDYPLRVYDSGRGAALEVSLDMFEEDFDFNCLSFDQSFSVTLGSPNDELKYFVHTTFELPLLEKSVITVKPKLITTSEGLRKYDPNKRKCFFDSERKLQFFKKYTQNNCELECLANYTKEKCGCVGFYQPRDTNTPVCGIGKILCYNNAKYILSVHLAPNLPHEQKHMNKCNCLPSCTSIEYKAVIDRVQFNRSAIAVTAGRYANVSGIQRAKLVIYFEDEVFETERRKELYTIADIFSICGGLLGLFMGISVLSIAEILYYSSLRWYWILRRPTSETNLTR